MFETLEKCPVCSSKSLTIELNVKDYFLSKENFNISKCTQCSFLFTNPRPLEKNIGNYYKSEEYISHSNKGTTLINYVYKLARYITLSGKLKLINSITDDKTILDYGCGTGDFLNSCKKNQWKINGFEPEKSARDIASEVNQIEIFSTLNQLDSIKKINLITLWHVLEHIPNLNSTLNKLTSKLEDAGTILIAVPNYKSYDAHLYKQHWAAYDVPRHLYHFSQETMTLLLNNHGLKINNIIPMKLDSFYVSLLSEKYKKGKTNYLKSFINGYKSNIYAKNNNNNYSSLIYIASK